MRDVRVHNHTYILDAHTPASGPVGRPINEIRDPFALEVHRAIAMEAHTGAGRLPELPTYVERQHDVLLREITAEAIEGTSRLVMLVGGSSVGKTRACWEAIQRIPESWRLWHPIDPSRPESALKDLAHVGPRTVVWLNEAQHYLLTPADGPGERVAAGLRQLLGDPSRGPVLVLGTIWGEYWATLTTPAHPDGSDLHAQARALLTGCSLAVPSTFDERDMQSLNFHALQDPRLAHAAEHAEQGQITQYLAGAPALLERYHTAPEAARALIEAAMDCQRLGHAPALPRGLLAEGVEGYLTDQQLDLLPPDWINQAFAYAAEPLRGTRGALAPIRPRRHEAQSDQIHYRLADYLDQNGRSARQAIRVPGSLWDALLKHAAPTSRTALGEAARIRGLLRVAASFFRAAADAGDLDALRDTVKLLKEAGRGEEGLAFLRAADNSSRSFLSTAGYLARDLGSTEEALEYYQRAVEAGDLWSLPRMGEILQELGRDEEALECFEAAADGAGGFYYVMEMAGVLLTRMGRTQEALAWYTRAAEAGSTHGVWKVASELRASGRPREATEWLQSRIEAGDTWAQVVLADLLREEGRDDAALTTYENLASSDAPDILLQVADRLWQLGRTQEALRCYGRAADKGDFDALSLAVARMRDADRIQEALDWLQDRAQDGDQLASSEAVHLLRTVGRLEDALDVCQQLVDAGSLWALITSAELLRDLSRYEEALECYQRAVGAGSPAGISGMAKLLAMMGRKDEALAWYRRAADAGDSIALQEAADLVSGPWRHDERLRQYGWDPDGTIAEPW